MENVVGGFGVRRTFLTVDDFRHFFFQPHFLMFISVWTGVEQKKKKQHVEAKR